MAVEYDISSDVAVIKETGSVSQCARVTQMYSGQITYDDEAGSKFATATINGKSQRVMLCIAVSGTVNYDDVPSLYSTVDGHRCLNIVTPTETGTPDDVPSLYETVVIDGQNVRAVRCIMINKTPVYDGVSSTCTFTGDDGKTHTAQLVNKVTGGSVVVIIKGTSPLNLPDAIANSLSYVKAFGGTEQRDIPDNYLQRQFIYMMDGSYIKIEDLPISAGYRVEFDFQTLTLSSPLRNYLGGRANGVSAGGGFRLSKLAAGGTTLNRVALYGFESGTEYYDPTTQFQANTRYKYTYNNGVCTLETGGSVVSTRTFTVTDDTSTKWGINAYVSGNDYWQTDADGIYVYSVKVWNDQGELVMNLVPAVQKGQTMVVGFYDRATGGFRTPSAGTFAAGGEAVPTPDTPMDIVSNNGVVKVSPNLLNPETVTANTYVNSSGQRTTSTGAAALSCTDYIKVTAGETYTLSVTDRQGTENNNTIAFNWFDSTKTILSTRPTKTIEIAQKDYTFTNTAPNNAEYLIVNFIPGGTQQVEQSSTETTYRPYGQIYTDGTVETINVHGKNLFDRATVTNGYYISATGQIVANEASMYSDYIKVKPSTTYTISLISGSSGNAVRVHSYTSDKNWIEQLSEVTTGVEGSSYSATFTTSSNAEYIRFGCRQAQIDIQIERGSTATTYAPYYDGGTATAEMLLKVGDYQDIQSIIDGVVTRNVGIKVLDGTENWETTAQPSIYRWMSPVLFNLPNVCICSHYTGHTSSDVIASMPNMTVKAGSSNSSYLYIRDDSFSNNLAGFKQFLADQYNAGTPVIVVYPLATPTTESVAGQTLQVTDGDNTLEITQASLNNLELEAQYSAAVSLTIQEVQDTNLDNNVTVTIQ